MEDRIKKVNLLGQYLSSFRSVDEALEMAMLISQDVLGYDHAMIRLLENDLLKAVKWIGFPREAADLEIHVGEGITGEVARKGEALLIEDTLNDPRFLMGVEGCRSELCVPMVYNGKTLGVFNVESEKPAFFNESDRHILETFASQLTSALEAARLREELNRAEKLSVVGAFASSILHDIRNDIHQLNICSDMLKRPSADKERNAKMAAIVKRAADNIYGLIEDIFDFVKTGKTTMIKKRGKLDELLKSTIERTAALAGDNIKITLNMSEPIELDMDEKRLGRVLINLTKNAVEAMPEGGELTINARRNKENVIIEVSDNGVGIEEDKIEKIWEPLVSFGKQRGTGLGMAIVKQIINDHGWDVSVDSEPGKGTTFRIKAMVKSG